MFAAFSHADVHYPEILHEVALPGDTKDVPVCFFLASASMVLLFLGRVIQSVGEHGPQTSRYACS